MIVFPRETAGLPRTYFMTPRTADLQTCEQPFPGLPPPGLGNTQDASTATLAGFRQLLRLLTRRHFGRPVTFHTASEATDRAIGHRGVVGRTAVGPLFDEAQELVAHLRHVAAYILPAGYGLAPAFDAVPPLVDTLANHIQLAELRLAVRDVVERLCWARLPVMPDEVRRPPRELVPPTPGSEGSPTQFHLVPASPPLSSSDSASEADAIEEEAVSIPASPFLATV